MYPMDTKTPERASLRGFLFLMRRLKPGLIVALHPLIEPLANVVGDYTCRNRVDQRYQSIQWLHLLLLLGVRKATT